MGRSAGQTSHTRRYRAPLGPVARPGAAGAFAGAQCEPPPSVAARRRPETCRPGDTGQTDGTPAPPPAGRHLRTLMGSVCERYRRGNETARRTQPRAADRLARQSTPDTAPGSKQRLPRGAGPGHEPALRRMSAQPTRPDRVAATCALQLMLPPPLGKRATLRSDYDGY